MKKYEVVRETKYGDVRIRGGFKSKESAKMFLEEYERVVPHIRGALKVVEEKPKTIAEEVLEEIWARKNEV
ncbi:MAG: hypothetical protein N2V75_00140 [Methanophagales archaeon]|nr:hypothetical protein [Methanophagales archaeon]